MGTPQRGSPSPCPFRTAGGGRIQVEAAGSERSQGRRQGCRVGRGAQQEVPSSASCILSEPEPSGSPRAEGAPRYTDEETEARPAQDQAGSVSFLVSLQQYLRVFFEGGSPACGRHQESPPGMQKAQAEPGTPSLSFPRCPHSPC